MTYEAGLAVLLAVCFTWSLRMRIKNSELRERNMALEARLVRAREDLASTGEVLIRKIEDE